MNLSTAVAEYVQMKRCVGRMFNRGERALRAFCRFVQDPPIDAISERDILAYFNGRDISRESERGYYNLLSRFFQFWAARDVISPLHLPLLRIPERQSSFPYVYSRFEIQNLLRKTLLNQKKSVTLDGITLRTLLLFLYATGAYLDETINLKLKDLDSKAQRVSFPGNGFSQNRCIPVCSDLVESLRQYLKRRNGTTDPELPLFTRKDGSPLKYCTLALDFRKLCHLTGISRGSEFRRQPSIGDLRSTFAVHRINAWIRNGNDLNRMLPALSAYLGKAQLISAERYLCLTPERFRTELDKLSPRRSKKHWRNDPVLMRFLAKL